MPDTPAGLAPPPAELSSEDTKLITLARAARARVGAVEGAAVRDGDGRTYTGVTVTQPSFALGALQLAVASAVAAGATVLEAAARRFGVRLNSTLVFEHRTLDGVSRAIAARVGGVRG